jgi:hypothetical protein
MQTIRRAIRSLGRRRHGLGPVSGLTLALGLCLAFGWLLFLSSGSRAAPLQQDTPSPSPSASASPSLTASPTITSTLSSTVTPTLTLAASATVTLTPTALPPLVASPTWTEAPALTEALPTAAPAPVIPGPTATPAGPTPTLLPLPSVTYQFPQVTPPGDLLVLAQPTAAQALPKGQGRFVVRFGPGRGWLLGGLILLWIGLGTWFVVTQFITRRH